MVHISGVTKFLTLSKAPPCDSVKNFVTHQKDGPLAKNEECPYLIVAAGEAQSRA